MRKKCYPSPFPPLLLFYYHPEPEVSVTHPAVLWVMCKPPHHSLQHVLFIAHVQLLHGQHLAQPVRRHLPELLCERHIAEMCLQELSGSIVDMVKAVVKREEPDADAVLCCNTAFQELAAQGLEVNHEEQVRRLHHVLDGVFIQSDLCEEDKHTHRY